MLNDGLERRGAEGLPARLQAVELARAAREIERAVPGGLEDPELPRPVARDATRRDVRDRAVCELDPGVRDVHVRREHGDPRGAHVGHFRSGEL